MCYADQNYQAGDVFLFGPETRGLPQTVLDELPPERVIRIPMHTGNRSLNLSNAVAVIIYEKVQPVRLNAKTSISAKT